MNVPENDILIPIASDKDNYTMADAVLSMMSQQNVKVISPCWISLDVLLCGERKRDRQREKEREKESELRLYNWEDYSREEIKS